MNTPANEDPFDTSIERSVDKWKELTPANECGCTAKKYCTFHFNESVRRDHPANEWREEFDNLFNSLGFDTVVTCGCFGKCDCKTPRTKLQDFIQNLLTQNTADTLERVIETIALSDEPCVPNIIEKLLTSLTPDKSDKQEKCEHEVVAKYCFRCKRPDLAGEPKVVTR
jgi:hypothetical protein